MNLGRFNKAIMAAAVAGGGAYTSAQEAGASQSSAVVSAVVTAVVAGLITWGVPNTVMKEVENVATDVVNTIEAAQPGTPKAG